MSRLVEIKVLEPAQAKGFSEPKLDGLYDHPARKRYINAWLYHDGDRRTFTPVGSQGRWELDEKGYCPNYQGEFEAWLVSEIDHSQLMQADRFEAV